MRIIPVTADEAIAEAVKVIAAGGCVVHPTETCYGIACDLTNPDAVLHLFAVKQRPGDLPVSVLFPSVSEAKKYVDWSAKAEELAGKYLPGPLTLVLPMRSDASHHLHVSLLSGQEMTGIRVSSHPIAQRLAEACGVPICTTSANVHGRPNPYSAEVVILQYFELPLQPDLLLECGAIPEVAASAVVEVRGERVRVLREGDIRIETDV